MEGSINVNGGTSTLAILELEPHRCVFVFYAGCGWWMFSLEIISLYIVRSSRACHSSKQDTTHRYVRRQNGQEESCNTSNLSCVHCSCGGLHDRMHSSFAQGSEPQERVVIHTILPSKENNITHTHRAFTLLVLICWFCLARLGGETWDQPAIIVVLEWRKGYTRRFRAVVKSRRIIVHCIALTAAVGYSEDYSSRLFKHHMTESCTSNYGIQLPTL